MPARSTDQLAFHNLSLQQKAMQVFQRLFVGERVAFRLGFWKTGESQLRK